jgi:hypothetical protein
MGDSSWSEKGESRAEEGEGEVERQNSGEGRFKRREEIWVEKESTIEETSDADGIHYCQNGDKFLEFLTCILDVPQKSRKTWSPVLRKT